MWRTAETTTSPEEVERQQDVLLEELAEKDPRVKKLLEALKSGAPLPGSESVEQIAEEEFGKIPEEMEEPDISEWLAQEGSMAPDRLALVTNDFHSLVNQGVPATLAYLQVGIDHKLTVTECDTLWELLKSQAEAMNDAFVNVDASKILKSLTNVSSDAIRKIVAQVLKLDSSASKTIVNAKASRKKMAAARKLRASHAMFPTEDITRLANEAAKHLSFNQVIPWASLNEAVEKIERQDSIRQFASRMYDCSINMEQADHEPLYQGVRDSVIFVLQCILEKAGYEWNPKKSEWQKW